MSSDEEILVTAGQLLSQAREQRKLSVADIALQLNLRQSLVRQIEADELDTAMLVTFVRGYLRAYARLVKLPEQQVLKAYEQQNGSSGGPAKPMQTFSNRTARQATENRFMWLTYAIGFVLVFMLVLWWWQTASPSAENASALQQSTAAINANDNDNDNDNDTSGFEQTTTPGFVTELTETTEVQPELMVTDPIIAEPTPVPVTAPESSAAVISMSFTDNCWIDVLDAEGNRIAYGTKEAGYQMTVTGTAPFVVTLGNPSVVQITINDKPFDMSSLPVGRVAKFTLAEPD